MINLILKNITKVYNKTTKAVDDVSFSAEKGQFLVLLGPSGCGKSSLLRMIAGLEDITSGELYFDNKLMNDISPENRNIGMVFQNYALYPHLSVFENIAFPLKIIKKTKTEIKKEVDEIADLIGLGELLKRKPKELSGGQRQRVALARALIRKPDLFLFDEPLSNLDAKLRVQMRTEIINIHQKAGTTSVYVTHDQTEAMTMGDLLVILNNGKIQQIDTPANIYKKPANTFVAGFIGSPQMNFYQGEIIIDSSQYFKIENSDIKIEIIGELDKSILNKKVTFGIRPEHLELKISNRKGDFIITNTEYLGYEEIIHFMSNNLKGIARTDSNNNFKVNDTVNLTSKVENIHLFDLNGERIKL